MRDYRPHGHIRPAFELPSGQRESWYAVDMYSGNGRWEATVYADTKEEARGKRDRYLRASKWRRS